MSTTLTYNKSVKSRKDRRCCYCGQKINKGDIYVRWTGIYEGDFQSNAWHPECDAEWISSTDESFEYHDNDRPPA